MEDRIFDRGFYYYFHDQTEPYINEALEELLLDEDNDKPLIMVWRNDLSVVLGRFQHPLKEVNLPYADDKDIKIIRRVSGGGTVYHDLGNVNYGIYANKDNKVIDYNVFLKPLQYLLKEIGYEVDINEGIDLYFQGKKISGSAQRSTKNRILHHGTLLFDPIKENMSKILKHIDADFVFKGTESRRARVGRLKDGNLDKDVESFMARLERKLAQLGGVKWQMDPSLWGRARELARTSYINEDWTYGKSPKLSVIKNYDELTSIKLELIKGRLESFDHQGLSQEQIYFIEDKIGSYLEVDYFKNKENSLLYNFFYI